MVAPSNTNVTESTTVFLPCVAFGNPLPATITWTALQDNDTIDLNSTGITIHQNEVIINGTVFLQSILELCRVQDYWSGYYTCSAENSGGSDSASFWLNVQPLGMLLIGVTKSFSHHFTCHISVCFLLLSFFSITLLTAYHLINCNVLIPLSPQNLP